MITPAHEKLCNEAERAIERIMEDTSVPAEETVCSLRALRDEIEMKLESLGAG